MKIHNVVAIGITLSLSALAHAQNTETISPMPVFHVTVTSRSVQAINYRHRSGATKVDFAGTDLMPAAYSTAPVANAALRQGPISASELYVTITIPARLM